ncbi:MAG: iron ABC transporter permease [Chloroflexi bacterium]|nr:iron ABC transporter permease [Chloroflexota bacterium]
MTLDIRTMGRIGTQRLSLRRGTATAETWIMLASVVVLIGFIVFPLLRMLLIGFLEQASGALSLVNFQTILASSRALDAPRSTAILAVSPTLVASLLGVSLAWITARTDTVFRNQFELLNTTPFFLSSFVGAIAWRFLLSPNIGLVNTFVEHVLKLDFKLSSYGMAGMIWVVALFNTPYIYLFAIASLCKMDPALEEAARVVGLNPLQTALRITLPLSTPAILSGALFAFILACGMLEVPLALGLPEGVYTLSMEIWKAVTDYPPNLNVGAAVGLIVMAMTIIGIYVNRRIIAPRSYVTVTGKGWRPNVVKLGRWRYATLAFNLLYILLTIVLPLGVLLIVSFSWVWSGEIDLSQLTLKNYQTVFQTPETSRGIRNSLFLAVAAANAGTLLAAILSYIIHRTRCRGRALLDFVATLPIAVPGVALGMALLSVWIATPLYQSLGILFLAYVTRWLPVCQKNIASVLMAVSPELDESARVSGGSWLFVMRRIMLPLLKPGLVASWLMLFVISIREMSASLLLYTTGTETMSVALWLMIRKDMPTVAAFAMVQTLILLVSSWLFTRVAGREMTV